MVSNSGTCIVCGKENGEDGSTGSWPPGMAESACTSSSASLAASSAGACPVALEDLRRVFLSFLAFFAWRLSSRRDGPFRSSLSILMAAFCSRMASFFAMCLLYSPFRDEFMMARMMDTRTSRTARTTTRDILVLETRLIRKAGSGSPKARCTMHSTV